MKYRLFRLLIYVILPVLFFSCGIDIDFDSDDQDGWTYSPPKDCGDRYCDVCYQGDCICEYWDKRSLDIIANNSCGQTISADDCVLVINESIDFWNAPDCSDMTLEFKGVIPNAKRFYRTTPPLIFHKSDWPYEDNAIYMATFYHGMSDEKLTGAYIHVNCESFRCTYDHLYDTLILALGSILSADDADHLCEKYPIDEESPCKPTWW